MMRCSLFLLFAMLAPGLVAMARAQKHTGRASPPTAPVRPQAAPTGPVVAVSSGLGAMQFASVNYGVPAPQSLARQLEAEDDRTRAAALAAIGAPGQYLTRGHIPFPHSMDLGFAALGNSDDLDAILTVELEQHMVSAILMPDGNNWKRVGTVVFPTPFFDPATTPATFLRIVRSFISSTRYRAIYHSYMPGPNTDYAENEAHVRILDNKAVVMISFVSSARNCDMNPSGKNAHPGCEIVRRWLQADPTDPTRRFTLVTGTGRLNDKDLAEPLNKSRLFESGHVRTYTCQPYYFSDVSERYEPTANATPCGAQANPGASPTGSARNRGR